MEVVEAAGDDPHRYDASGRIDAAPHSTAALDIHLAGPPRVQVLSATVVGYSVGGARRPPVPNYQWER